jgi:hypothetical protein
MDFPITRESLKAFNREFHIAEKERLWRYDFYMILIKKISTGMEQTLLNSYINTPVTQYIWRDIRVIAQWKTIMNQPHMLKNIMNQPNINLVQHYSSYSDYHGTDETLTKYLPEFISLLKENFIDCNIIVDPLKTYLIIDWS